MEYEVEGRSAPDGDKVEVPGATFKEGKPESGAEEGKWRHKLGSREEKLKYLQTAERYWYGKEWFGSEKRKTPA